MADAALVGKGTSTSNTVTTASGTTATGDTLIVSVTFDETTTISSVADSKGNSYTLVASVQEGADGGSKVSMYRCEKAIGGTLHTATVNFSGTAFPVAYLVRLTDVAGSSYDAGSLASGQDTSSPFTVTSGTFAQADTVVISSISNGHTSGTNGLFASSNFTVLGNESDFANFWVGAVGKLVVSATTAVTPSWTRTGSGNRAALIVAGFKAAKAPPPFSRPPKFTRRAA